MVVTSQRVYLPGSKVRDSNLVPNWSELAEPSSLGSLSSGARFYPSPRAMFTVQRDTSKELDRTELRHPTRVTAFCQS